MDSIIKVDNVSMHFKMDKNRTTSLKEWVVTWLKGKQQYETFQALSNVSFEVKRGEIVGIMAWIGRMNNIRQCAEEIILAELIYG